MKADSFNDQSAIVVALNRILTMRIINDSNGIWLSFSFFYKLVGMMALCYSVYLSCLLADMTMYNYIASVMYVALLILSSFCGFSMQILGWWYYKDLSLLRKSIAETDESLKRMNVVVNHRNVFVWTVTILTISFVNGLWYVASTTYLTYQRKLPIGFLYNDLLYCFMLYIGGAVALDFMMHVCWLRNNFKRINDLLKKFFIEECQIGMEEWNNKMVSSWLQRCLNEWHVDRISRRNKIIPYIGTQIMKRQLYPVNKISMLQRIRYVHLQLCTITKSLNMIFDKQMILFSTVCTLNLVAILYYYYSHLVNPSKSGHESWFIFGMYLLDGFYVWLRVVLISRLCEKIVKEAKEIAHIIHVCTIHNSDIDLKNELIQFSLQVSLSEVDREDTHLFWLNDTFVTQSIGAVVTYLVVMIQWNETANSWAPPGINSTVTIQSE